MSTGYFNSSVMSNLGNEESGNCISLKTNIASTEENSPHILHVPPMASCPVYCYLDQYISTFMSFILFLSVFTVIETLKISKFQNIQDISHPNLINNFSSESSANILDESCLGRLSSYSQISQYTWKESLSGVDKLVQNAKVFTLEITPLTQPFTPPQLLLNHFAKTFTPSPKSGLNPMAKCFTTSSDVALNPSAKPFSYHIDRTPLYPLPPFTTLLFDIPSLGKLALNPSAKAFSYQIDRSPSAPYPLLPLSFLRSHH